MSVTVRPPEVRSFVSSWKTFTAAILLDRRAVRGENRLLSREPAPGAPQRLRGPRRRGSYWCCQATENEPFELMSPVCAFMVEPETMSIRSGLKVLSDAPFAVAPEKLTVP